MEDYTTDEILRGLEVIAASHGKELLKTFQDTLNKRNIKVSNMLIKSLNPSVTKEGDGVVLSYAFLQYGRALEIRYHKRKALNPSNIGKHLNRDLNRVRGITHKKKNVRWYSKNAYKSLGRLYSRVSYHLSDAICDSAQQMAD